MPEMARVAIIGGGMAGCAAALSAVKAGAEVILFERSDILGGLSLVAGTFGANGQLTGMEEAAAMGAHEIPELLRGLVLHENVLMSGKEHVFLYDCRKSASALFDLLGRCGIGVRPCKRVVDVKMRKNAVAAILPEGEEWSEVDAAVDATGTSGPLENCGRYGLGCVECAARCPTFGGRVSIAAGAGVAEQVGLRADGSPGTVTAAFTLVKETLSEEIRLRLEREGAFRYKVPEKLVLILRERIGLVPTSVTADYAEYLTLEDTGYVNVIGIPFLTREELSILPGFEAVQYAQPFSGWRGNAIRYMSVADRDDALKVRGLDNLFVAGDKTGGQPNGVTEAFITGTLAGHNAARHAAGAPLLEIPQTLAVGDFVSFIGKSQNLSQRYAMMWGPYFERMKGLGLYTTDVEAIRRRVAAEKLAGVFERPPR
jgi:hypothetical protein